MKAAAKAATTRVLLIDDDPEDYLITKGLFEELPAGAYSLDWVDSFSSGLDAVVADRHDIFLIDYRLGAQNGLQLLSEARARQSHAAVILLTGQGKYEIDRQAIEAGAADYLEKGRLDSILLERSIRHALLQKNYEATLQAKVRERTAELEQLNEHLSRESSERSKAVAALQEADSRKDEFLAILAHELRNPLAPIRNAVTIMKLRLGEPEVMNRAMGIIDRQVIQMVRLIDELVDVSRLTRNKLQLVTEPVTLAEIFAAAVEVSHPRIEKAGAILELPTPPLAVVLMVDRLRLSQVVAILFENAAKYSEPGGRIVVETKRTADRIEIAVQDFGAGIPREHLPYVFELFTQIDRHLKRAQRGLGIGLAMAHRLVTMHGGQIAAASDGLGKGSTFTMTVPVAPTAPPN